MAYHKYLAPDGYFGGSGGAKKYAEEIKRKEAAGVPLSDPAAGAAFKRDYATLFGSPATAATATPSFSYSSPYGGEIQSILGQARQLQGAARPTLDQLRTTPEFGRFQTGLQEQREQAFQNIRAMLAAGGDTANLQSSPATIQFGNVERKAQADIDDFLLGMQQQEESRKQQQTSNLMNFLGTLTGLEGQGFQQALGTFQAGEGVRAREAEAGRFEREFAENARRFGLNYALQEAGLTGQYQGGPTLGMQGFQADQDYRSQQLGLDRSRLGLERERMGREELDREKFTYAQQQDTQAMTLPFIKALSDADTTRQAGVTDYNSFAKWWTRNRTVIQQSGGDPNVVWEYGITLFPSTPAEQRKPWLQRLEEFGSRHPGVADVLMGGRYWR